MIEQKDFFETESGKCKVTIIEPEIKNIKWSININQKAIIENGFDIDLIDAAIFDFMFDFIGSGRAKRISQGGKDYYWIAYQYIIDSLPLIKLKNKEVLARHIKNLSANGLIDVHIDKEMGFKTFFSIGAKANLLFFSDTLSTQKSNAIDSKVDTLSTQKSNNSYINNTIINTDNMQQNKPKQKKSTTLNDNVANATSTYREKQEVYNEFLKKQYNIDQDTINKSIWSNGKQRKSFSLISKDITPIEFTKILNSAKKNPWVIRSGAKLLPNVILSILPQIMLDINSGYFPDKGLELTEKLANMTKEEYEQWLK